jgi:hypothetical protein
MESNWQSFLVNENEYVSSRAKLAQSAAAKIQTSKFDALTFLAELTSVKEMFFDCSKFLIRMLKSKQSLPLAVIKEFGSVREISCAWLAARYGWRPLFNDMMNLSNAIESIMSKEKRSRYSETVRDICNFTEEESSTEETTYFDETYTKLRKIKISYMGCCTADIELSEFQFNPLLTAWEIVPFSFVLDWFVGVGKSLAAISFLSTQTNYSASWGYLAEITDTYSWRKHGKSGSDWTSTSSTTQDSMLKLKIKRRVPCGITLIPQLTVNLDSFKIFDLLGMVVQQIRR